MPAGASAAERDEVLRLAHGADALREARAALDDEAGAALRTARARFERAMIAARGPAKGSVGRSESSSRARSVFPRTAAVALAAAALIAVMAIAANQVIFRGAETVSALEPGDYAQVEGVVTDVRATATGHVVRVASAIGEIEVETSDSTSVVDEEAAVGIQAVERGSPVVVAGVVGENRRIAATALAISRQRGEAPVRSALRRLTGAQEGLAGSIVALSLPAGQAEARVVVRTADGRQYLVVADADSVARLLQARRPLGAAVRVAAGRPGLFSVELVDAAPPEPAPTVDPAITAPPGRPDAPEPEATRPAAPATVSIEGLVLLGEPGRIVVLTRRGRVTVEMPETARILPAASGILPELALLGDPLVGRLVVVRGGLDAAGAVVADVVVIGREAGEIGR
jgi:hypothetical protein